MQITMFAAYNLAVAAGFSRTDAIKMAAIWQAESGLDTAAHNPSGASGLAQINLSAHPDVTQKQAEDPWFSAQYSKKLWDARGGNWNDWEAYTNGAYVQYVASATGASGQFAQMVPQIRQQAIDQNPGNPKANLSDQQIAAILGSAYVNFSTVGDAVGTGASAGFNTAMDAATAEASALSNFSTSFASLLKFPGAILAWIADRNNWFRVVKVLAGGAILIMGISIMSKPVVAPVVGPATKAAKVLAK